MCVGGWGTWWKLPVSARFFFLGSVQSKHVHQADSDKCDFFLKEDDSAICNELMQPRDWFHCEEPWVSRNVAAMVMPPGRGRWLEGLMFRILSQTSAAVVFLVLFDHAHFITFTRNQRKVSTCISRLVFQTLTTNTSSVLNKFRLYQQSLFLCCFRFSVIFHVVRCRRCSYLYISSRV